MTPTRYRIQWASLWLALLLIGFVGPTAVYAGRLYTCPMHPQVIRDAPGDCPICGMHLVPVPEDRAGSTHDEHADKTTPAQEDEHADVHADHGDMQMPAADEPHADAAKPAATHERKILYYKSTMMPGEVSPEPAKDSMGMDMVPVYEDETAAPSANGPTTMLRLDEGTVQRMNLRTAPVEGGALVRELRVLGEVTFNERTQSDVTLKFDGWVERLYVNAMWTNVKAADPLFEVYSPELYNASLNYIAARRSEGTSGGALTDAASERLRLYGVPAAYIASLSAVDQPPRTLLVRSPQSGTVVGKNVVAGQKINAGQTAFSLADLSSVWVLAQVYPEDSALVARGAKAEVKPMTGSVETRTGIVSLVEPVTDKATRTDTVRIVLPNADGALRPGMYVEARIRTQTRDAAVLVPDEAVLRSGERSLVFVALGEGRFAPREVTLGSRDDRNRYEVTSGLKTGETVVTSGQFLLDSESQLREAIAKMIARNQ